MPDPSGKRDLPPEMEDRLIVALDLPTIDEALDVVEALAGVVSFFKIGFRLGLARGADRLYEATTTGGRQLFLDAKMFDVRETITHAVKTVIDRGASFLTVHGDPEIMKAAAEAKRGSNLKILAVTVLTNLDDAALWEMGYRLPARELVMLRARNAVAAGCDGVIASADDNPDRIRDLAESEGLLVATPGIRLKGGDRHDQKRVADPREAILNGADYLVVGRPIIEHPGFPDRRSAALEIISHMQSGWDERRGRGA